MAGGSWLRMSVVAAICLFWPAAFAEEARVARFHDDSGVSLRKSLPEMAEFSYDPAQARFERASVDQIRAAFRGTDRFRERGSDGQITDVKIDLNSVPYWIYARYSDPSSSCLYLLVDGYTRVYPNDADEDAPIDAPIRWGDFDTGPVILRDCGTGYRVLSLEGYGSVFEVARFEVPDSDEIVAEHVVIGLAQDFVTRLITGLGGRDALQKIFDGNKGHDFYGAPRRIAAELRARGFRP